MAVGTSLAARGRGEVAGLVGLFVNTLVLRAELVPGDPTSARCWRARARTALEAFAHQDLPFERLVEAAAAGARPEPARRSSR